MGRKDSERGKLTVRAPQQASKDFVEAAYHPPGWATGYISRNDTRFLYEALAELEPATIVEIGVASGVSTVLLLEAIQAIGLDARLYSFDITDVFYAKPELRLGHYIFERYGTVPERLSLNPLVASVRLPEQLEKLAGRQADFTFIDANHYHPWPCLDLIAIIRAVKPGSWVALHDINLPILAPEFPCYGPLRMFTQWPGEKRVLDLAGQEQPNIGAIKLFDTIEQNVDAALAIMRIGWDVRVERWEIERVYEILREMGGGRENRLLSTHFRNMPSAERRKLLIERAKDLVRPLVGRLTRAQA